VIYETGAQGELAVYSGIRNVDASTLDDPTQDLGIVFTAMPKAINSREHLESLFEAQRLGVASLQDYLSTRLVPSVQSEAKAESQ